MPQTPTISSDLSLPKDSFFKGLEPLIPMSKNLCQKQNLNTGIRESIQLNPISNLRIQVSENSNLTSPRTSLNCEQFTSRQEAVLIFPFVAL